MTIPKEPFDNGENNRNDPVGNGASSIPAIEPFAERDIVLFDAKRRLMTAALSTQHLKPIAPFDDGARTPFDGGRAPFDDGGRPFDNSAKRRLLTAAFPEKRRC